MDIFENDKWTNGVFRQDRGMFSYLNNYLFTIWKHVREQMDPVIEDVNLIPAVSFVSLLSPKSNNFKHLLQGEYTIKNFHDVKESIDFKSIFYGYFRNNIKVIREGENIFCFRLEVESLPPNNL